ncbi:MAG: formylglycine-generating enzyme family protein [Blastocatellia bacterium]|nr:formylglycine-generating enzyme family protein [Blastocatellia bacterium]
MGSGGKLHKGFCHCLYTSMPKGEYRERTTEVGSSGIANGFGLYDMHGNVAEWCKDIWHPSYNNAPKHGSAWMKDFQFPHHYVARGGSWISISASCRSASRDRWYFSNATVGFRPVVSL